jgi:hypothetical protein
LVLLLLLLLLSLPMNVARMRIFSEFLHRVFAPLFSGGIIGSAPEP